MAISLSYITPPPCVCVRQLRVGDGDTWRVRPLQPPREGAVAVPLDALVLATNTSEYKEADEPLTLEAFMVTCETHLQEGPVVDQRYLEASQRRYAAVGVRKLKY